MDDFRRSTTWHRATQAGDADKRTARRNARARERMRTINSLDELVDILGDDSAGGLASAYTDADATSPSTPSRPATPPPLWGGAGSRRRQRFHQGVLMHPDQLTAIAEARKAAVDTLHPSVGGVLRFFAFEHLPPHLQTTSAKFCELALYIAASAEGPEVTVALRKLLEGKDAAVRATLP